VTIISDSRKKTLPPKTPVELGLVDSFAAVKSSLPGNPEVRARREKRIASFDRCGLPTRKIEEWRYTDIKTKWQELKPAITSPLRTDEITPEFIPSLDSILQISLINGQLLSDTSASILPNGITVQSLSSVLTSGDMEIINLLANFGCGDAIYDLNCAFMTDGMVLRVADGVSIDAVELIHYVGGEPRMVTTRSIVLVGRGSSLGLIENVHTMPGGHQINDVLQVIVSDGGRFSHVRNTIKDRSNLSFSTLSASVSQSGILESFIIGTQSELSSTRVFVDLYEEGQARLSGVRLLNNKAHADTRLTLYHNGPESVSHECYRSVINGEAKGVFQGKITVQPTAHLASGRMLSNYLSLSKSAVAVNKPELEIFAEDVTCSHGATCCSVNEQAVFYLMSRGISRRQAENMLIKAFVVEVINDIDTSGSFGDKIEFIHSSMISLVKEWTENRSA